MLAASARVELQKGSEPVHFRTSIGAHPSLHLVFYTTHHLHSLFSHAGIAAPASPQVKAAMP